ncbi:hypothetical protein [Embleya sp. NPDC001921]
MANHEAAQPTGVRCPNCGGSEARSVENALSAKGASRKNLHDRLAKGPNTSGDGCLHFVEGMVMVAMAIGFAYTGVANDKPLYTIGGAVVAVLLFVGTIAVVRGDRHDKDSESAGEARADPMWKPAHYCPACEAVFCPGDTPWRGTLAPEQFKRLVWRSAGYEHLLAPGDKAKTAEIPEGTISTS